MKPTFDFRRLTWLIRIEFAENGRNMLLMGSVLVTSLFIALLPVCFFDTYNHLSQLAQYAAVPLIFIFGSSLYTSTALTRYASGPKGMLALMVPASASEKLLGSLLVNLLFLVFFAILFWQVHYHTIAYANSRIPATDMQFSYIPRHVMIYICYCYFLMHSGVFLGSVYFVRSPYVKTLACIICLVLFTSVLNSAFARYLASYPLMMGAVPFSGWNVVQDSSLKVYRIAFPDTAFPLLYLFPAVVIAGLWFTAYQRLKEKQI